MPPPTPISGYRALFAKDPVTNEVFQIASTSSVVNIDDLGDVDTGTTGPTGGQVLVWDDALGQWVPGSQASTLDDLTDVTTIVDGPSGPTGPPDGSALVWDEAQGQWIPGPGASEVEIGATMPTGASWELWFDTGTELSAPTGGAGGASTLDGLLDVDTSTTPPADGQGLVFNQTTGLWTPGVATSTAMNEVVVAGTDPRLGGHTNATIWFDTNLPAGQRMKVWDGAQWVAATVGPDGDFLPLTGGTLTGNLTFNGTNAGINFTGGGGIYDWTDKPLTLRENTAGGQPKIINNDGSGGRDIIDTTNGDERYLRTTASTTHDVSWLNGFSGTCQYRVNQTTVTVQMQMVGHASDTAEPTRIKLHDYPSGVSAPWADLKVDVSFVNHIDGTWWNMGQVHFDTDGCFIQVWDNRRLGANESFSCTASWAR